jgi:hypothetical protein
MTGSASPKKQIRAINSFMLPLCPECSGPASLSRLEPHPTDETKELRTFLCADCGAQQTFVLDRR